MEPTRRTPHGSAAANYCTITDLPAELLLATLELFNQHHDRNFTDKADLLLARQVCKKLRDASDALVFRNLTLTLALDSGRLPELHQPWQPLAWEDSHTVCTIQKNALVGPLVRHIRLRICAFPVKSWTDRDYEDRLRHLVLSVRRTPSEQLPDCFEAATTDTTASQRQDQITRCYAFMFGQRGMANGAEKVGTFIKDLVPTVKPFMSQLTSLQAIEAAGFKYSNGLYNDAAATFLYGATTAYTDRIILHTLPKTVQTVLFCGCGGSSHGLQSEADERETSAHTDAMTLDNATYQASEHVHSLDYPYLKKVVMEVRTPQLLFLYGMNHDREALNSSYQTLRHWQHDLEAFQNLTKIGLGQTSFELDWPWNKQSRYTIQDLLGRLVMLNVADLALGFYCMDVPLFCNRILVAFPAAKRLLLEKILMTTSDRAWMPELWIRVVEAVASREMLSVVIDTPFVGVLPPWRSNDIGTRGWQGNHVELVIDLAGVKQQIRATLEAKGIEYATSRWEALDSVDWREY